MLIGYIYILLEYDDTNFVYTQCSLFYKQICDVVCVPKPAVNKIVNVVGTREFICHAH